MTEKHLVDAKAVDLAAWWVLLMDVCLVVYLVADSVAR